MGEAMFEKVLGKMPIKPSRDLALKRAERWILERLEGSDGLGAIFPPIINTTPNSPSVWAKVKARAETSPGQANGSSTRQKVRQRPAPSDRPHPRSRSSRIPAATATLSDSIPRPRGIDTAPSASVTVAASRPFPLSRSDKSPGGRPSKVLNACCA